MNTMFYAETTAASQATGCRAEAWLLRHYARGVTVNDAADAVGLTRSGLFRAFRQHTGKNPKTYLDDLRVAHALKLLGNGGYRMKEIAADCGFYDARHFYRAFLRKTGVPPRRFPAQHPSRVG